MGFSAFLILGAVLAALVLHEQWAAYRLRSMKWDEIVDQLQPIPFRPLETIALDHLQPGANQTHLEATDMWVMIGGLEGLERMRHNADLIIALAAHVRHWNFTEGVIVAERIRQDSILLKRALRRIEIEQLFVKLFDPKHLRSPFYVHQASSAYYLMRQRLLLLYEHHQFVLYPRLAEML